MPRPSTYASIDPGDEGISNSARGPYSPRTSYGSIRGSPGYNDETKDSASPSSNNNNADLSSLEQKLAVQVDEDLFDDPREFHTLQRVIDVLGLQLIDDAATVHSGGTSASAVLAHNPAYRDLKRQQEVVEQAIEHMAVTYCADLNGSVIRVGQVSRRFTEAVSTVRQLRRQVRDIQETIGAAAHAPHSGDPNNTSHTSKMTAVHSEAAANAMSLRELWLKKLECEAVLSLLNKLDIIRAAPSRFDFLVQPPCRIGAAVLCLSQALATSFHDDMAQVQALHKIMEQLMLRKQKAEELIWDTLLDVIFLRTANGVSQKLLFGSTTSAKAVNTRSTRMRSAPLSHGVQNPFQSPSIPLAPEEVDDDEDDDGSVHSQDSGASLFSIEDDIDDATSASASTKTATSTNTTGKPAAMKSRKKSLASAVLMDGVTKQRMMIPIPVVEAELDLAADERRCLEQSAALYGVGVTGGVRTLGGGSSRQQQLPRYADPVLSLRILVECLARLRRLDDVERILSESLEYEIRAIVQREQGRTFTRIEKRRASSRRTGRGKANDLKDFRRHWTGILSGFGCVMLRLSHLAQILRFRIGAENQQFHHNMANVTSTLHSVVSTAYGIMQKELKEFLQACVEESADKLDEMDKNLANKSQREGGLFSLGIIDEGWDGGAARTNLHTTTRKNVMEMPAAKFVNTVLFAQTNHVPQVHHALIFRRSLDRWTSEIAALNRELAAISGQDTTSPSYKAPPTEETAIEFLDTKIQNILLPVLQQEAVDGTVVALEMSDAFDPLLDRAVFSRQSSSAPMDVDMSKACQVLLTSTSSLFMAIHRLPDGGEMYLPLVAVLEHVILTFLSRVKAQVANICESKTAFRLLMEHGKSGGASFSSVLERRGTFAKLLRAYEVGALEPLEATQTVNEAKDSGLAPLAPPEKDTESRYSHLDDQAETSTDDIENPEACVEKEEEIFGQELVYLTPFLDFLRDPNKSGIGMCSDEELMKAASLAHSLLKVSSLLESRLQVRGNGYTKTLSSTRALREAIKTLKQNGIKMAKFCRIDMLMQTITKLSKICKSSTLIARDAVRIPSSVNELGEYMTGSSDYLREAAGSAVTAFTFSCLEQYIPLCLIETVKVVARGEGIVLKSPITMNGIEALDRSGSVLYRDLKGATSFDGSFWDVELAAVSFERSASFIAMMELEMEELEAYYAANADDFAEPDFRLMFCMDGPRRKGDLSRYHALRRQLQR